MTSYAMIALYVLCSPFPTVCWLARSTPNATYNRWGFILPVRGNCVFIAQ